MYLDQEGRETWFNISWEEVENALAQVHPRERSFFSLSAEDGSYVQTAGARLRLIVEHRRIVDEGFEHYVIGKSSEGQEKHSVVNYSGGGIQLFRNEVLTIKDATAIFRTFFHLQSLPEQYQRREITNTFLEHEFFRNGRSGNQRET